MKQGTIKQKYPRIRGTIMAGILILTGVFPSTIQAENRNDPDSFRQVQTPSVSPDDADVKGLQDYITDKNTLYTTLHAYTNRNVQKATGVNFIYSKLPEYSIEKDGIQQQTISSPVYIGVSYVSHTGGTSEQTLYSSLFSKAVMESVMTTTTHGAKVGAKAGAKFKIPIVGETSIELNAEYNFSYAGTNTSTETITYTVPAQPVKLQPNQTAKITAILKMVQSTGDVKLRTMYKGEIESHYTDVWGKNKKQRAYMGDWVKMMLLQRENQWLQGTLDYSKTDPSRVYQDGKGTYQATYGTTVEIQVEIFEKDVQRMYKRSTDNLEHAKLVRSHSYEIQPKRTH